MTITRRFDSNYSDISSTGVKTFILFLFAVIQHKPSAASAAAVVVGRTITFKVDL